jgi:hypothetical protein
VQLRITLRSFSARVWPDKASPAAAFYCEGRVTFNAHLQDATVELKHQRRPMQECDAVPYNTDTVGLSASRTCGLIAVVCLDHVYKKLVVLIIHAAHAASATRPVVRRGLWRESPVSQSCSSAAW